MVQKQVPKLSEVVTVFVGLAMVFAALTVVAQWLFSGNSFIYTILVSLGAAIFGAGLAFFLLELAAIEAKKTLLTSRVSILVGLALVYMVLVLVAQSWLVANPMAHTVFVSVGATTFGGGLTFFLVDRFSHRRQ